MPEQPMGAGCGVILLIACWLISLLSVPPSRPHPNYFAFMQTESELNSLEEESFHVLIFDLKTYQRVLSALLRAEAFLETLGAPGTGTTFYLLHIIDPCTLICIQIHVSFATFTLFSLKLETLAKVEWGPHLGGFQMCHCSVLYMSIKEFCHCHGPISGGGGRSSN